jgi:hypothetical protein
LVLCTVVLADQGLGREHECYDSRCWVGRFESTAARDMTVILD